VKENKEKETKFTSVTYVWSWLRRLKGLQNSYSCNYSDLTPIAPYGDSGSLQLNKLAWENYSNAYRSDVKEIKMNKALYG